MRRAAATTLVALALGCAHAPEATQASAAADATASTPLKLDQAGELGAPKGDRIQFIRRGQGPGRPAVLIVDGLNLIEPLGRAIEAVADVVYLYGVIPGEAARAEPQSGVGRIHVDRIEALREHLELDRISLVGHSHQGLLALEYAIAYPQRVDKVIAIDGLYDHALAVREHLGFVIEHLRAEDGEQHAEQIAELERIRAKEQYHLLDFLRTFEGRLYLRKAKQFVRIRQSIGKTGAVIGVAWQKYFPPEDGEKPPPRPGIEERMMELVAPGVRGMDLVNYTVLEAARVIQAEVLLVQGAHDQHTSMAAARALDAALPHSKLVVMEHSGHIPCFEEPEQTSAVVLEFLGFASPPPPSPEIVPETWKPGFPPPDMPAEQAAAEAEEWWQEGLIRHEVIGLYGRFCGALAEGQVPPEVWQQAGVPEDDVSRFVTQVCERLKPMFTVPPPQGEG